MVKHVSKERGFTLIEVMVAVVIVSILAAIAYPSYRAYVVRAQRAAAKTVMLEAAQYMERVYTAANRYDRLLNSNVPVTLPEGLSHSPKDGPATHRIQLQPSALTPTAYTIEAVPLGRDESCGTLALTSTGRRSVSGTDSVAQCWR